MDIKRVHRGVTMEYFNWSILGYKEVQTCQIILGWVGLTQLWSEEVRTSRWTSRWTSRGTTGGT